jgi:hypothetical protein
MKASLSLFYAASCRSCNTFHLRLSAISDAAKCGPSRGGLAIAPPGGTPMGIGGFDMAGIGGTIATFRRGPGESYSDVILRIAAQK